MASPYKHAIVVYNPRAGSLKCGIERQIGRICDFLSRKLNYMVSVRQSQRKFFDGMIDDIPADECDLIVVVGGDGTVKSVLGALEPKHINTPVAIVPLGTANFLARAIGAYPVARSHKYLTQFTDLYLPRTPVEDVVEYALNVIAGGVTGPCDIANVNGEPLAIAGGMGSLADAVVMPKSSTKQMFRMFSFAPLFLKALIKPDRDYYVKVDDGPEETIRAQALFFVNVPAFGLAGWWKIDEIQDGQVDMVTMYPEGFADTVKWIAKMAAWIVTSNPKYMPFTSRRVRKAEVRLVKEHDDSGTIARGGTVMVDGESIGRGPLVIDVRRHATNFCLPPWVVDRKKGQKPTAAAGSI